MCGRTRRSGNGKCFDSGRSWRQAGADAIICHRSACALLLMLAENCRGTHHTREHSAGPRLLPAIAVAWARAPSAAARARSAASAARA